MPGRSLASSVMPRSPARLLAVVTAVSFWFVGTSQALGAVGNVLPGQGSRAARSAAASEPVVDAEVLGISVVRRADGSRAVHAEIRTDEVLRLELRVIRYQSVIARIAVRRLRPDRWLVTLALPATLTPGRARAQVRLEDRGGAVAWYGQPIRIPKAHA